MRRRSLLEWAGVVGASRLLAGCDRFVVLEPRVNPELSPITPIGEFYTYSYGEVPEYDADTHEIIISYRDQELASFGADFLATLKPVEIEHTLQCVGSRPRVQRISNAVWTGLPFGEVLEALGVAIPDQAVGLRMTGMDDYDAGIEIEEIDAAPMWLFWGMNGEPLPFIHGAPARLFVPGRYGVKAMKWIREIAFVDEPHESFWTRRGWDERSANLANTLIASPLDGIAVDADEPMRFVGTAFAGEDPVVQVDVRINGGEWAPAEVDYQVGAGIWVLWSFEWSPPKGRHTVQFRCTTESGAQSDDDPLVDDFPAGYAGSMQVTVNA